MNNELYEKISRLAWLLHKQQLKRWADGGPMADTTRGQGRILAVLKLKDGISTKDLAYLLGVHVSSLNGLLSKLEKSGLIAREPFEQDKRIMLVKLTEKGKSLEEPRTLDLGDIFSCLSNEEQAAFGEYLDRVTAALAEKLGYDVEEEMERMAAARDHFAERLGDHMAGHGFHRLMGGLRRFVHGDMDPRLNGDFGGFGHRGRGHHHEHD
ncbi:MAG: MarR family transcriptional regulator [Holophagales bacterium]|nr:MarR family transcriptional regulator [Holophagales bacterium]